MYVQFVVYEYYSRQLEYLENLVELLEIKTGIVNQEPVSWSKVRALGFFSIGKEDSVGIHHVEFG